MIIMASREDATGNRPMLGCDGSPVNHLPTGMSCYATDGASHSRVAALSATESWKGACDRSQASSDGNYA